MQPNPFGLSARASSRLAPPGPPPAVPPLPPASPPDPGLAPAFDPFWRARTELLIGAVVALVIAAIAWWLSLDGSRRLTVLAVGAFAVGALLFGLAGTIETWCAPAVAMHGTLHWGEHAWHSPSLWDCLTLSR